MSVLVFTPAFQRVYRKFVRKNRALQEKIDTAIEQMEQDVFQAQLGTHDEVY